MFDWKSQAFPGYHPVHEPWNTKIVDVHWGVADQQGLVAEYRINFNPVSGDTSLLYPDFTAYALTTGDVFDNVNMGASGFGYTVLTRGLICFGKPKNGPSCFLVAPDFDLRNPDSFTRSLMIRRGVIDPEDDDNRLIWQPVGGGAGLVALSFAGEAFFATYIIGGNNGGARIEMSLDGINWAGTDVYPGDIGSFGGSVANNGTKTKPGGYASAGYVVIDPDDFPDGGPTFSGDTFNLAWAAAPPRPVVVTPPDPEEGDPGTFTLDWHYNQAKGMNGQPGSKLDAGYGPYSFGSTIGGGKKKFVAAGTRKENLLRNLPAGQPRRIPNHTAAACVSSNGTSWTPVVLPGVTQADHTFSNEGDTDASSYGTCAAFIRTKADDGYFLCGQYGYNWRTDGAGGFEYNDNTSVYKSDNGTSWGQVRNSAGSGRMFLTLSAIDRDMGEVVRL
jgi:hypothetical protein